MAGAHDVRSAPHDHVVDFYGSDASLVSAVGRYVADGFVDSADVEEDVVLIIATGAHRHALYGWLASHGVDIEDKVERGLYIPLDAADTLGAFMVDGVPDSIRFSAVIEPFLRDAADTGRDVRAFGEMVSLLWDEGNIAGATALEDLWNGLAAWHHFSLYCAYSAASMARSADFGAVGRVRSQHSELVRSK